MAGFMSGFGSAFSQSFQQGLANRQEKDRDAFKLKYADYISRRDTIEKEEKEAQGQIKAAKAAVARAGAPAEMWGEAYKILRDGGDIKYLDEWLSTNQFVIEPTSVAKGDDGAPATPQDSLTQQAQSSVDAQMSESGMAPPQDGGIFGNLKEKLSPVENVMNGEPVTGQTQMARSTDQNRSDRATQAVAGAAGVSPEQVNKTLGPRQQPAYGIPDIGFKAIPKGGPEPDKINTLEEAAIEVLNADQSGDPARVQFAKDRFKLLQELERDKIAQTARAKAIAEGTYAETNAKAMLDKEGKFVKIIYPKMAQGPNGPIEVDAVTNEPIDPAQAQYIDLNKRVLDRKDEITDKIGPARKEYTDKVNNAVEMVRLLGDARKLYDPAVGGDPRVLTYAADVAQQAQSIAREVYTGMDLVTHEAAQRGMFTQDGYNKMLEQEAKLKTLLGPEINSLAGKKAMFDAKMKLAAYRGAMMEGMSGRDISNQDIQRWDEILASSNDPKVLQEKLGSLVGNKLSALRNEGTQVIRDNQQVIDFEKEFGFNPWGDVKDIDTYLSEDKDPLVKSGMDYINAKDASASVVGDDDWSDLPDWAPNSGISPSAFKKLSPRGQELLKKKLGVQ